MPASGELAIACEPSRAPTPAISAAGDVEEEAEEEEEEVRRAPRLYEELQDEYAMQTLLIVHGRIMRGTPDFESFQRTNEAQWPAIDRVLDRIERVCRKYEVSVAEINGRALSEAARLEVLTDDDIINCLRGVERLVQRKRDWAALIVQRNWRLHIERENFERRKRLFRAAFTIQRFWRQRRDTNLFKQQLGEKLAAVEHRAMELSNGLHGQFPRIEADPHIVVHFVPTALDLTRCFDLMYRRAILVLILAAPPEPHIWDEFLELFAQCGVFEPSERLHFIILRDGPTFSDRLIRDLKSAHQVRRLICGRPALLIPHGERSAEAVFSVSIGLPILGTLYPIDERSVFQEAGVVPMFSTRASNILSALVSDGLDLMRANRDIRRWMIRLAGHSGASSMAWFDATPDVFSLATDLGAFFKRNLHCVGRSPASFLALIASTSARIEGLPTQVRCFPTVALLLTGLEIRVVGTLDRVALTPTTFGPTVIPAVSVPAAGLIRLGRQVGSALLRRGILGYVMIDFVGFSEDDDIKLVGFDIRTNTYPHILTMAYFNLCSGYDAARNAMIILNSIHPDSKKCRRWAVIMEGMTHPAMGRVGSRELRKAAYANGLMFDLLNRVGFRIIFCDAPATGRGIAIAAGATAEIATATMEKALGFLLRFLAQIVGNEEESSIAQAVVVLRQFRTAIFAKKRGNV
jgi:hypothetical protein